MVERAGRRGDRHGVCPRWGSFADSAFGSAAGADSGSSQHEKQNRSDDHNRVPLFAIAECDYRQKQQRQ